MRPPTPRLRINSEDIDLNNEPPYKNTRDDIDSQTLYPPTMNATNPFSTSNTSSSMANNDFIADLIANSDPNDISVL